MTNLKEFMDDKSVVAIKTISVLDGVENIAGMDENAGYQLFLLFPRCLQKMFQDCSTSGFRITRSQDCVA